jgi:two-component sensor histidine kinase/CheY-like chemotaxis protein
MKKQSISLLYLEDSQRDLEIISELLLDSGFAMMMDATFEKDGYESLLRKNKYDIILSDFKLPGFDAFGALEIHNKICPEVPFICVSGSIGEETAIELIKQGAVDYIIKDNPKRLPSSINRALREAQEKNKRIQAEVSLQKSEALLSQAMDIARLAPWEYDVASDLFTFNDKLFSLFRTTAEREGGYTMTSSDYAKKFVHPDEMHWVGMEMRKALDTADPDYYAQLDHRIIYSDGQVGYISVHIRIEKDAEGRTVKTYGVNQDITERKQAEIKIRSALEEKEVLLREVHHRVKNNLQAMISLVSMRSKNVKDIETQEILKGLELQARTMSLVYEQLYQSEDLSRVQMAFYIEKLVLNVVESFGFDRRIERKIEIEKISLDVAHAMPCGLIINELVTNSMKYAFPPQFEGTQRITVKMYIEENACVLSVADSGVGLPIKFDIEKTKSNGLRLVKLWATHQLGGTLNIDPGKGSRFDIRFNIQQDKK